MMIVVGLYTVGVPATAIAQNAALLLSVDDAVALALRDNPGLAEIQARAEALAAVPSQEGTLPDPTLRFNALNLPTNSFALNQEPMTQMQIGLSQGIPFPGKLALRQEAAEHEAEAATNSVQEARLRLIRDTKSNWWQLYYLDRALDIVRRNQNLLRQFVTIATTKYEVGQGLQQDVLLAQVELSRLLDLEIQLTGARRTEAARLNALLNRAGDTPVDLPVEPNIDLPAIAEESLLYPVADETRPLLAEQRKRIDAARSRAELAEKNYYPDFELGAVYGFRQGHNIDGSTRADFATFGLAMSLPVYAATKQAKGVDQRHSELLAQTHAMQDSWTQIRKEITSARAGYEQARQEASLLQTGIIPQSQQAVASMLSGYQVDKVDFLNLVRAQITLYNYEIEYWRAVATAKRGLAQLAAAVGKESTLNLH